MQPELFWGLLISMALAAGLLVPYLVKELKKGKRELGPRTPTGAGDVSPGRRGDPAPGQPDGQSNPYSPSAQRGAPHIKS